MALLHREDFYECASVVKHNDKQQVALLHREEFNECVSVVKHNDVSGSTAQGRVQ